MKHTKNLTSQRFFRSHCGEKAIDNQVESPAIMRPTLHFSALDDQAKKPVEWS
jgi:hypothetical protein